MYVVLETHWLIALALFSSASDCQRVLVIACAMQPVGFGLTVLAEVRTIVKSVEERNSCFKEEEDLVTEADDVLSRVTALADKITSVVDAKPTAIPEVFLPGFKFTEESLKKSLASVEMKLLKLQAKYFPKTATGSGVSTIGMKKTKQFAKAKSITKALPDILGTASRAGASLKRS